MNPRDTVLAMLIIFNCTYFGASALAQLAPQYVEEPIPEAELNGSIVGSEVGCTRTNSQYTGPMIHCSCARAKPLDF